MSNPPHFSTVIKALVEMPDDILAGAEKAIRSRPRVLNQIEKKMVSAIWDEQAKRKKSRVKDLI